MRIADNGTNDVKTQVDKIKINRDLSKALENEEKNTVNVIVRVRPLSTVEHANPSVKNIVQCLRDGITVNGVLTQPPSRFFGARNAKPRAQHFRVDKVFHPHSTQIDVYTACREIVAGVFDGINGAILAYGATGTGKTHTMFGSNMSAAGVVYQALQDVLERKEQLETTGSNIVTINCTFLEVYNEEVFDLLAPPNSHGRRCPLKVQERGAGDCSTDLGNDVNHNNLVIKGLTRAVPKSAEEFAKLVEFGQKKRFVASTHANAESSRSHSILTMEVEVRNTANPSLGTIGRIRFCDLAGSERAAGTSNRGIRLQEGGNINRSLLALAGVVQALKPRNKNLKGSNYIPYRGSKLTRLLRDCLSGGCRTLLLFCVSPSSMNYEETINTMLFAMQAKEIQFLAKRHHFCLDSKQFAKSQEALIEELHVELAQTRDKLLHLMQNSSASCDSGGGVHVTFQNPQLVKSSEVSCSACLTSSKSEKTCTQYSAATTASAERQVNFGEPFLDGSAHTDGRLSPISSATGGLEEYVKLKKKLKGLSVEKETLYREMQEAQKAKNELDIRLRQLKWKLARFLSTKRDNLTFDLHEGKAAPVGIAGLKRSIHNIEVETTAQGDEMEQLLTKINTTDRKIATLCQELQRKKQHPFLELMLENVKLRQSSAEAECLAAHYHQECRCLKNREEEYAHALGVCVSAIKTLLPFALSSTAGKREAQLAIMLAKIPSLPTKDMISVFERNINSGNTTSVLIGDSHCQGVSIENKGACLQRQPKECKKSSNGSSGNSYRDGNNNGTDVNATRLGQQSRLWCRTNTASAANTMQERSFGSTKSGVSPGVNATHVNKESSVGYCGTRAPQMKTVSNPKPVKKSLGNRQTSGISSTRCMSSAAQKSKRTLSASAPPSQLCNETNNVPGKTTLLKEVRIVASENSFGRGNTVNVLPQDSCSQGNKKMVKRTRNREETQELQRSMTTTFISSGDRTM